MEGRLSYSNCVGSAVSYLEGKNAAHFTPSVASDTSRHLLFCCLAFGLQVRVVHFPCKPMCIKWPVPCKQREGRRRTCQLRRTLSSEGGKRAHYRKRTKKNAVLSAVLTPPEPKHTTFLSLCFRLIPFS